MTENDYKQKHIELEKQIESTFNMWMSKPETKLALSLIPASEVPDAVRILLMSAFKCGCDLGAFQIVTQVFDTIAKGQKE